jgi:hypothetical protein
MTHPDTTRRTVTVDFLYLDLEVCGRCRGTNANLETALSAVSDVLGAAGAEVRVNKTLVDSEAKARALGFVSSPTLRVNGRDVALDLRESPCESEACACASGGAAIDCRVWVYRGEEHTQAPVPMIVDAILAEVYGGEARPSPATPAVVPENLQRFFRSRGPEAAGACCDARREASCCEPSQKEACCETTRGGDAGAYGCQ